MVEATAARQVDEMAGTTTSPDESPCWCPFTSAAADAVMETHVL